MLSDRVHLRAGLGLRHARFEPADGVSAHLDSPVEEVRVTQLADGREDVAVDIVKRKAGRKNADDGVVGAAQINRAVDHSRRAAEVAMPECIAQQNHRRSADVIIFAKENRGPAQEVSRAS